MFRADEPRSQHSQLRSKSQNWRIARSSVWKQKKVDNFREFAVESEPLSPFELETANWAFEALQMKVTNWCVQRLLIALGARQLLNDTNGGPCTKEQQVNRVVCITKEQISWRSFMGEKFYYSVGNSVYPLPNLQWSFFKKFAVLPILLKLASENASIFSAGESCFKWKKRITIKNL